MLLELKNIQSNWTTYRNLEGTKWALEVPAINEWFTRLGGDNKKRATSLFGKLNQLVIDSDEDKRTLLSYAVLAFENFRFKENLDALDTMEPENIQVLTEIFATQDDIEATLYHQITKGRLSVINKLKDQVNNINLEKEIQKLPVINKNVVKSNFDSIVNRSNKLNTMIVSTSGTTGSGMKFPETREMEQKQWAVWCRFRKWHGIKKGTWCGWFGGRIIISPNQKKPPYWRSNYPMKQVMFSAYHLNAETVDDYFHKIIDSRLTWLHGYPSQIAQFAHLCLHSGLSNFSNIKIISVGGENLLDHQYEIIKQVFNASIIQHYALA